MTRPPPISTLFPNTTLFRSDTDHNRVVVVDVKNRKATPLVLSDPSKLL